MRCKNRQCYRARGYSFLCAGLVLLLQWCWPWSEAQGQTDPVPIGILGEYTGGGAPIMEDCERGIQVAQTKMAARFPFSKFNLIRGDTQDDAKVGLSEFRKMAEVEKVWAAFITRSRVALPVNPVSQQLSIPIVASSAHPALIPGNSLALRIYPNAKQEGDFLAEIAARRAIKRVMVITLEDEWNVALSKAFIDGFQRRGGAVAGDSSVLPADQDFAAVALSAKRSGAEAILVNVQLGQYGAVIRRLREAGSTAALLSNYYVQKSEVLAAAGAANLEGTIFVQFDIEYPRFAEAFRELFADKQITPATYIGYVAMAVLGQALAQTPSPYVRAVFQERLMHLETVDLLDGPLLLKDREAQFNMVAKVIKNGRVEAFP